MAMSGLHQRIASLVWIWQMGARLQFPKAGAFPASGFPCWRQEVTMTIPDLVRGFYFFGRSKGVITHWVGSRQCFRNFECRQESVDKVIEAKANHMIDNKHLGWFWTRGAWQLLMWQVCSLLTCAWRAVGLVAMGQNPVPPVNLPIPTKIDKHRWYHSC